MLCLICGLAGGAGSAVTAAAVGLIVLGAYLRVSHEVRRIEQSVGELSSRLDHEHTGCEVRSERRARCWGRTRAANGALSAVTKQHVRESHRSEAWLNS